jgi:glutamyl-tRNA(Gln) amidotransferase subunit E
MYPDTDRPPIVVTQEILDNVNSLTPRPFWEDEEEMVRNGVPSNVAHRLVVSDRIDVYKKAVESGADPKFTAVFLMEDLKALERKGADIQKIEENALITILSSKGRGDITSKGTSMVLMKVLEERADPEELISSPEFRLMEEKEARKIIRERIEASKDLAEMFRNGRSGPLMGILMTEIGVNFPGARVMEIASDLTG